MIDLGFIHFDFHKMLLWNKYKLHISSKVIFAPSVYLTPYLQTNTSFPYFLIIYSIKKYEYITRLYTYHFLYKYYYHLIQFNSAIKLNNNTIMLL